MDNVLIRTIDDTASLLKQMYALCNQIQMLETLYDGAPSYTTRIDQDGIDSVQSYKEAGLTKAQLDAAVFILKTARATIVNTDIVAVSVMSKL